MAFASPGVSIKEVDLTPTINVSDQNVGAVVIAAETGPVDTVTFVTSEKELVDTFGKPNDNNYESWFAASTIIQYGGIAAVVRPTSSNIVLNSSSDAGLASFIIKSKFDFDNYSGTAFKFAGRSAGSLFNSIKVVAVDHGADQIITYTIGSILTKTNTSGTTIVGEANEVYSSVSGTSSADGSGATFTITRDASGDIDTVEVDLRGNGYIAGETITIDGTSIGGVTSTDDLVITVSTVSADPTVAVGDAIKILNNNTEVGTGWIYKADATANKLYIILADSTKRIPSTGYSTYSITDNAGTPVTLVNSKTISNVANNYYDTLEYASGLKWRDVAPQPGTSASVAAKGGKFDEMHILVLDEDGIITGTPNTILEKYLFVSKAKDASTLDGALVYFHTAIAERSKYVFPGYSTGIDFIASNKVTAEAVVNASIGETNSSNKVYSPIYNTGVATFAHSGTAVTSTTVKTYTNLATTTNGTGSGATFNVTSLNGVYTSVTIASAGSGYKAGDTITINGTLLNGTSTTNDITITVSTILQNSTLSFSLTGGTDYDFTNDASDIAAAVTNGYELLRDSETFNDVDFLIPGSINPDRAAKLIDIAESRRDCVAVISPRRSDVINSSTSAVKTENIVDFFSGIASSSFAMFDSGYKYIYDKFNDTYRYVPCAADVAGLCINTTINSETWFSPAGYNRGNLRNATKLAYSPKQSERDRLYTNRINPIVSFPGQGIVLFGDKTALSSPSTFNRINVRRLFIEIEKNIARFSKFQLFEINDEVTRSSFKAAVEPYLRGVQGRRGIYDFLVVCDETNNTSDVIDRNEFNAEIYVKPARSINFITITFIATRTGISFGELTQ